MDLPSAKVAHKLFAFNLDLIPLVLPEYDSVLRTKGAQLLKAYKRTALLVDRFISISNFSKAELCKLLNVGPDKVSVVNLAADKHFSKAVLHTNSKILPESYILTMGGSEPRKNVKTVIEAYSRLSDTIKSEYKLVIAGGKWHGYSLEYKKNDHIIELGYVPDDLLPALYANSSVFVFASIYEGFGFTILEAMAAGSPVINARGSSLDEVAGNATLSFSPNSPQELTEQLVKVLGDSVLRKNLIKKGYVQNANFSWQKSAEQLHKLLVEN
jgi:glycosyltransferase involved in cell wall biosynthesis